MTVKKYDDCKICEDRIRREVGEEMMEVVLKNILHEIRNPVTQIGGLVISLGRIFSKLEDSENVRISKVQLEKIKYYGDVIRREMKGLEEILSVTDEFFTHKKVELREADLNKIVEEAIEMVDYGERDRIRFLRQFNLQKKTVIDPVKIKMLVLNLLINAKEAIFEHDMADREPRIEVMTGSNGNGSVFLEIRNNGRPISSENIKKIFDLFFTTKGNGRGRGLAIVNAIVRAHKGAIDVKNLEDGQTSFKILLPHV